MTNFPSIPSGLALLLLAALPARSQTAAIQTTNGPVYPWTAFGGAVSSSTAGWSFETGTRIMTLSALGVFDGGGDGLMNPHQVGIWSDGGALLAQTTVPGGTGGTLDDGYRYAPVTPVDLAPGTVYHIGAFYSGGANDEVIFFSTQTFAPELTYLGPRFSPLSVPGVFAFPNLDPGASQGVFGPNFQFTSVPEVSSAVLTGAAVLGPAARRRRAKNIQ